MKKILEKDTIHNYKYYEVQYSIEVNIMSKRNVKYYSNHGEFTYGTEITKFPSNIAKQLVKEFNLNVNDQHCVVDGNWYQIPSAYPVVLFDIRGYLIIQSKDNLKEFGNHIIIKEMMNICNGIHKLSGYVKFSNIPKTFDDYKEEIELNQLKNEKNQEIKNEKFLKLQNIMKKSCLDNNVSTMLIVR